MSESKYSTDFLERTADIEEEFEDIGYEEGLLDGKKAGDREGCKMGCEYGLNIGRDIGFYVGWVSEWLSIAEARPEIVSERTHKQLQTIQKLLDEIPTKNVENANFQETLKKVERKFKVVTATLGVNMAAELPSNTLAY
ncbi:hypothetical protein FBU59_005323 [Linderina macrospora]|uniref:Uncharacterized protein n=1 Tax=Linderina macrospora TaxID=4868 RepID=A0ACC1J2W4_9FUNG|nr:hypothetical protein FBU59_005323 [Linderina macrospora]